MNKDEALIEASSRGIIKVVKLLLEHGADVDARNEYGVGSTALMEASYWGHTGIVKLLLEHGADVDARNEDGDTALVWAEDGRHADIQELLIKAGAK